MLNVHLSEETKGTQPAGEDVKISKAKAHVKAHVESHVPANLPAYFKLGSGKKGMQCFT
jgi:hypothetical protein